LFKKILVPLDGSEHSLKALDAAASIAQKFGGDITLLNAYSIQPVLFPEPSNPSMPAPILTRADVSRLAEGAERLGNRIVGEGEQRIKSANVQVKVKKIVVEGHAVEEIVRVANQENIDLIVIGARGVSHMREMLLGSVTDGVMHHVRCPVLVIK
jgi:nucleotide-binding universal stress UspA family protein